MASAVRGELLFWSAWFVVWACAQVGVGVLAEIYIRRHARTRGWDQADRPVLLRPLAWSLGLVAMSALMGSGHSSLAFSAGLWIFLVPLAWRERRRGRARIREGEAGE
ncbi:hypothetical protein HUT06_41670 [Actinomadura sp. NAK00032]|uniref:hypothetical protein n=1 Tax=Actinomadura sp. NAK00032 TaxID=2742128 RepID=UPI001591F303|nr:hypothetical protein [Actinomadura sp. NAK00032]QKW39740.1 hypothetical protein HUT06_41670 [Actinomadura sp. NAK00032]